MTSHLAARAIEDAVAHGKAIAKFISPNDVGTTGGHQYGFYLPKAVWQMFTPNPPIKGENAKSAPQVTWPDGRVTDSSVTWYGRAKDEYRLTRFGKDFPYLDGDSVGSLLVIVPVSHDHFLAHILDTDDDIQEVQATLGLGSFDSWSVYDESSPPLTETPTNCVDRRFRDFVRMVQTWPTTVEISTTARESLLHCITTFSQRGADAQLMDLMEAEFQLFRLVERQLCSAEISRVFGSIDDFLKTASTIMNRRKSRAGWSLEHHAAHVLTTAGVQFTARPKAVAGEPDMVIPSVDAYLNPSVPRDRVCILGIKTTCKDRWRQVLNEGAGVPTKHLLTTQPAISATQLQQMNDANVKLVVPASLHAGYPKAFRPQILKLEDFIRWAKTLGQP